jgi:hypothetical protein
MHANGCNDIKTFMCCLHNMKLVNVVNKPYEFYDRRNCCLKYLTSKSKEAFGRSPIEQTSDLESIPVFEVKTSKWIEVRLNMRIFPLRMLQLLCICCGNRKKEF